MQFLNQMMLMSILRQGNPKAAVEQLMQTQYRNNPTMQQLYQMGLNNDTQGLEQYARQVFAQQGRDFDAEYNSLMSQLNQFK